ncbi:MAG: hypothetical protein WD036_10350 [Bauldia sp.]
MSEPSPGSQTTRRAPLSLGRRIGVAVGTLVVLYSGGCSWLVLPMLVLPLDLENFGRVLLVGGIPLAGGSFVVWSAFKRPPSYAGRPPLTIGRLIVALVGIVIMFLSLPGALSTGATYLYDRTRWKSLEALTPVGEEAGYSALFGSFAGIPFAIGLVFTIGLLVWWLAIRVGR